MISVHEHMKLAKSPIWYILSTFLLHTEERRVILDNCSSHFSGISVSLRGTNTGPRLSPADRRGQESWG